MSSYTDVLPCVCTVQAHPLFILTIISTRVRWACPIFRKNKQTMRLCACDFNAIYGPGRNMLYFACEIVVGMLFLHMCRQFVM